MPKWEYLVIRYDAGRVQVVNGMNINNNPPIVFEYLSIIGKEGWEVIAVSDNNIFAKRPLSDKP